MPGKEGGQNEMSTNSLVSTHTDLCQANYYSRKIFLFYAASPLQPPRLVRRVSISLESTSRASSSSVE